MPMGFVYILFNPEKPSKVKIGLTIGTAEQRAKDLCTTGVSDRFYVVYDELVRDCGLVERKMHQRFAEFRRNNSREFFEVPMKMAVRALIEEAEPYRLPESALTKRAEILPKLRSKFPKTLNSELSSVAVIQLPDLYLLELRAKSSSDDHEALMERVDLEFIEGIDRWLPPGTDVRDNVAGLVDEMNLATLLVISEALFSEEGRVKAIADYNTGLPREMLTEPAEVDEHDDRLNRPR